MVAMQMDGTMHTYTHFIDNLKISFYDTCNSYSKYYNLPEVWIQALNINTDFILGLNFILDSLGGITINRDYVQFHKRITQTPILTKRLRTNVQNLLRKRRNSSRKLLSPVVLTVIRENLVYK